ncbi:SWIM zinc finger family protein, partial [Streptomyces sp. f51]|uniref:SWIM zinc finger family protein n=1 Tax=Streptomyces sp. f51 TaxID=1827742 RepID=UPI00117D3C7B
SLRPTTRPVPGAVCLPGPERLVALQRVLRDATALRVYGPVADGAAAASAWEVVLPGMRLTLTLSPDSARGFSGEGGVLKALATDDAAADAELVSVLLAWEPRIGPASLAEQSGLSVERVRAALTRLGTAGRVGYDLADAAYFHRELPYDADRAERHNPRLVAARRLAGEGAVSFDGSRATVVSGDRRCQVRESGSAFSCTCQWWADYRGRRGPCKHALAVRMVRRGATVAGGAR